MRKRNLLAAFTLVLVGLLLLTSLAYATTKLTDVLHSWDDDQGRYENGNLVMYLDGTPQPFYIQLDFDNNEVADACGAGTSTQFAGPLEIGLYHTDTPADNNAPGFQAPTADWGFVPCSVFASKKYPAPGDFIATCSVSGARCDIVSKDVVGTGECGGNCSEELLTTLDVNLDTNCDGSRDAGFESGVCLYWTAVKPPFAPPYWEGNIQARVEDASQGGDKTINFSVAGPNALSLRSLKAHSAGNLSTLVPMLGLVAAGMGVILYRRRLNK